MKEIRRKLGRQDGVTLVFALVIFLIMALFSYVMVNASLTAAQGAAAERDDQQNYSDTYNAACLIRDALITHGSPFTVKNGEWTSDIPSTNPYIPIVRSVLLNVLNGSPYLQTWGIKNNELEGIVYIEIEVNSLIDTVQPKVEVTVKLEHWRDKADFLDSPQKPSDYKMKMTIKADSDSIEDISNGEEEKKYKVTFKQVEAQLGIS